MGRVMDRDALKDLTRALKGAPMSCLFVMLSDETAWGTSELARMTGYSRKTITQGLEKLREMNLAQSHRRFNGWFLTKAGYQLGLDMNPQKPALLSPNGTGGEGKKLPLEGEILPDEGEKLPLAQRSSSSSFKESLEPLNKKQLLLDHEGEKLPDEGEKLPLVELLVKTGCPRRTAQPAIEAALRRGEMPDDIKGQVKAWVMYCQSDLGQGINNRALFIAAKIKNGEPAPEVPPKEEDDSENIQWIT